MKQVTQSSEYQLFSGIMYFWDIHMNSVNWLLKDMHSKLPDFRNHWKIYQQVVNDKWLK